MSMIHGEGEATTFALCCPHGGKEKDYCACDPFLLKYIFKRVVLNSIQCRKYIFSKRLQA